jgi:hypothetical protein
VLTEELDPGLFHRAGVSEEKTARRMEDFLRLLHGAIAKSSQGAEAVPRKPRAGKP